MNKTAKISLVIALYGAALTAAGFTFNLCQWRARNNPDLQGGMAAFGDSILVLGVLGLASIFPTALALFFLRSYGKFWRYLAAFILVLSATGPLAVVSNIFLRVFELKDSYWALLQFMGLMRILSTPVLATGFTAFAFIAPEKPTRLRLLVAASMETGSGLYALIYLALHQSFV